MKIINNKEDIINIFMFSLSSIGCKNCRHYTGTREIVCDRCELSNWAISRKTVEDILAKIISE
jgi:hypothetical protein